MHQQWEQQKDGRTQQAMHPSSYQALGLRFSIKKHKNMYVLPPHYLS